MTADTVTLRRHDALELESMAWEGLCATWDSMTADERAHWAFLFVRVAAVLTGRHRVVAQQELSETLVPLDGAAADEAGDSERP